MIRVPGCRSRGLGFDSGATRFSEKYWIWNAVNNLVRKIEELL
jgi:hypothetical protein